MNDVIRTSNSLSDERLKYADEDFDAYFTRPGETQQLVRELIAEIRRLRRSDETCEWRPIETAPKERCTVVELAWDPDDWTTGDGFYFEGNWIAAAFFHSNARASIVKGPAHEIREWICHPTHWRPRRSDNPPALKANSGLQVGSPECAIKGCGQPRAPGSIALCADHRALDDHVTGMSEPE